MVLLLGVLLSAAQGQLVPKETVCRMDNEGVDTMVHVFHRKSPVTSEGTDATLRDSERGAFALMTKDVFGESHLFFGKSCGVCQGGRYASSASFISNFLFTDRINGDSWEVSCTSNKEETWRDTEEILMRSFIGAYKDTTGQFSLNKKSMVAFLSGLYISSQFPKVVCLNNSIVLIYVNTERKVNSVSGDRPFFLNQQMTDIVLIPTLSIDKDLVDNERWSLVSPESFPLIAQDVIKYKIRTSQVETLAKGKCYSYGTTQTVCARNGAECATHATCIDNPVYRGITSWVDIMYLSDSNKACTCIDGFEMKDGLCQDIEECATGTHKCNKVLTTCRNIGGGYECVKKSGVTCPPEQTDTKCLCSDGYVYNAVKSACEDKDECAADDDNKCDKSSTDCKNIIGGYRCVCKNNLHEPIDEFRCGPLKHEFRLLDPNKAACCHKGNSGAFLLQGTRHPADSPNFKHLTVLGCLQMRGRPLPIKYKSRHLKPYVATQRGEAGIAGGNVTIELEMETLADFVEIVQTKENLLITGVPKRAFEIHAVIRVGKDREVPCFKEYFKELPTTDQSGDTVLTKKVVGYLAIDQLDDQYSSPASPKCNTLPTNTQWLEAKLYRKPPAENSDLYKPDSCPRSAANPLRWSGLLLILALMDHRLLSGIPALTGWVRYN